MEIKPNGADFQDAYHYALAAADDEDSAFCFDGPRDKQHGWTRKQFLEEAAKKLVEMGFETKVPSKVKEAKTFADNIHGLATTYGFDAYTGEKLCKHCGQHHPSDDHDYYAKKAAAKLYGGS